MENMGIEEELVTLEKKYWQAMKDKDTDTMLSLSDDPCIVAGPQGFASFSKQSFLEMMNSSDYTLHNFEIDDDIEVRMLGQDTAVVAYKVREDLCRQSTDQF
jgi:hypothetical protein